jgi:hypothetical protein
MPADYAAWWRPMVQKPFNANAKPVFTSMDDLILRGVKHSAQVKVFSDLPLIRRTAIDEAEGRFDTHLFLEGKYAHTNEPVGTTLQTGQPGRFVQDERWLRAGARQPFKSGGELEISERIGTLNNNSQYLIPPNQGNSRFFIHVYPFHAPTPAAPSLRLAVCPDCDCIDIDVQPCRAVRTIAHEYEPGVDAPTNLPVLPLSFHDRLSVCAPCHRTPACTPHAFPLIL